MVEDRLVLTYTAEVNDSGTEASGTWRLRSSVLDKAGSFRATRKP